MIDRHKKDIRINAHFYGIFIKKYVTKEFTNVYRKNSIG